jgi:glycerophosphoryl diester phosphodiesterase
MREAVPDMALGLLTWKRFPIGHAVAAAAHLDVQVLAVRTSSLWRYPSAGATAPSIESIVENVHASQRQVLVWCPNTRRALDFAAANVDALVVDDVPRHVQALRQSTPKGVDRYRSLSAVGLSALPVDVARCIALSSDRKIRTRPAW